MINKTTNTQKVNNPWLNNGAYKGLWIGVLAFLFYWGASGQVVFENSDFTTISSGGGNVTSISMNYNTGTANNRILMVAVSTSRRDVFSATFDGEPLALLGNIVNGNSRVVFFYMIDPPSGLLPLVATLESDDRGFVLGAATFSNVNLLDPLRTFTQAASNTTNPTINNIPTASNSYIFSAVSYRNSGHTYSGLGTDQVLLWNFDNNGSNDRHRSVGSRKFITTGSTTSISYQISNGTNWSAGAVSINPMPVADLGITKTVNESLPFAGQTVTFTLTASNTLAGNANAPNVVVNDLLPSGFTYASHNTATGNYNPDTGLWDIGTLNFGATATLTIEALVNDSGNYENIATISGFPIDNNTANNTASVTIEVCQAGPVAPLFQH